MRPLLLFAVLLVFAAPLRAQEVDRETYLVVRIPLQGEKSNAYYTIEADLHNDQALDLYELVPFNKNFFVPKKGISFYYNRPDTATQFYNYFKSESEALDFIGRSHWQLVTVLSEISSGRGIMGSFNDQRPYTTVSSSPVYYFKKKVEALEVAGQ